MKYTIYPNISLCILLSICIISQNQVQAQCPQVEAILIDACGTEQLNEFIIIHSGGGFNTSDIQLDYDQNNNILGQNNNDINIDNGNWPANPTPCGIATGNVGAFTGCSNLIAVGAGVNIPANAIVVLQTSGGSTPGLYNFASLCGAGECVYVVSSSCVRSAGAFSNGGGGGMRTTNFSIAGGCNQSMTYDQAAVTGGNGAYFLPNAGSYGNGGCSVPPSSPASPPPVINPIANVTTCGSYTLPAITGTNLPANTAYFTGPNGGGTQYNPGDMITMTTTLYAFAQIGPVGCSDQEQFTVTITPPPTVNLPADVNTCGGQNVNVPLTGNPGATFPWTNDNTATGLGASGTGNINFTAANVSAPQVSIITITPTQGSCTGPPVSFNITVNPGPTMDDPPNQSVCGGEAVTVTFTSPNGNPTYNWTNNNPAIGLPANGTGNINFTAASPATIQTATITVTPSENGCSGPPQTFTITVTPIPTINQPANVMGCGGQAVAVNFTGSPGATFNWTNSNTAIGLGASGTGNLNFTAANVTAQEIATITITPMLGNCAGTPVSFTITINIGLLLFPPADLVLCGGQQGSFAYTTNGNVPLMTWFNNNTATGLGASGMGGPGTYGFVAANVTTTQVSVVTATAVENGCTSPPASFMITVNPTPILNQPPNVVACAGQAVNVNFTGSPGTPTFNWTNDNPAIGLGASGTGNLNFTAANVVAPVMATITVTPVLGNCTGNPVSFTITVNPSPTVDQPANITVCGGLPVNANFSGSPGATFNWTNSNTAIGLAASGNGNINFNSANVTTPQTATITVTPTTGGCSGPPVSFTITVNPGIVAIAPANIIACGGDMVSFTLNSNGITPIYSWTNDNTATGLGASGNNATVNFVATNVTTQQVSIVTFTATENGCASNPANFTITINPSPTVDDPADQTVCAGDQVAVTFTGNGANPTYSWTNSNTAIGLGASGSGNINFTSANVTTTQTGNLTVTATENGCTSTQMFAITVNPVPTLAQPVDVVACGGTAITVAFAGTPGATFNWTNDNPAIGLQASGNGTISFTAANGLSTEMATITVTPVIGPCVGTPRTFTITIEPTPSVNPPANQIVCGGDPISVVFTGPGSPNYTWVNSNTATGLASFGSGNINFTSAFVSSQEISTVNVTPSQNGCVGTTQTFTLTVSPAPTVNLPGNVNICSGQSILINLSGTNGATFNWTNDNPAIGLPASGTGNLDLTAAVVTTPQTGTVTITPTIGTCDGVPVMFTITINPRPSMADPADQTVCAGAPITVNFSSPNTPTYSWTNSNPAIGLAASGTGNISFTTASVSTTQTATLIVTPAQNGCTGTAQTFTITVNPSPMVDQPANVSVCNGENVTVNFTGTPNAVFSWTNSNPAIGLAASGTGNLNFTTAPVTVLETAIITVTPAVGPCPGTPVTFTITVSPGVGMNNPGNQAACVGDSLHVLFTGTGNPIYSWTNDNPLIGLPASGTGDIHFLAANVGAPEIATITVTPESALSGYAYITNYTAASNSVTVIDLTSNAIVATIPVGNSPYGVSVNPAGSIVYVTNNNSNTVSVIDVATNTVITTVPVGNTPRGIAVSPDGSRVYVANIVGNTISVIDAATNMVIATVPSGGGDPYGIVFSPDGSRVYVANSSGNSVTVLDAATNTLIATVPVSATPFGITVSPDGSRVYVTQYNALTGNTVAVIETITNTVIATIPVGFAPHGLVISPDGSLIYVANESSDNVSVINTTTNTVIATIPVGAGPTGISITPDGKWVYVVNILSETVSVINTATNAVVATVPAGSFPVAFGNFIAANPTACTGAPQTFTITVSPSPTLTQPNDITVCGNVTSNVQFTTSAGATVSWTNDNPAIGLAATGTGNISFIAADLASPQTATITATPMVGSCSGTALTFTVTVNPAANGSISGDQLICAGDSTTLTASGGSMYEWDNSETTAAITVSPTMPTTYVVIITNSFDCAIAASALVDVNTAPVAAISGNTALCGGQGTTLTASGGGNYSWSSSAGSASINVSPAMTTTYTVTVTNSFACSATAEATVTVNPADTINLALTSCNPVDTGTVIQNLQNQFGCDSTVTTVTNLTPSNTVNLTALTCDPNGAGTFTQNLMNQFGCDSTVVTTVTFDPAAIDTTVIGLNTCDPNQVGSTEILLTGVDGCDSLVITNTSLSPTDTTNLTASTCDPSQVGISQTMFTNQAGCDSIVILNTSLLPSDTTNLTAATCDPSQVGISQTMFTNQAGCDSIVILNTSLLPTDTTNLTAATCDPSQVGISQTMFTNQAGCDSIVITNTSLLPSDTTNLTATTCDPSQVGISQTMFTNQAGCDSIVITNTSLLPSDTTNLTATTCDPSQVGISQTMLTNQAGCDSIVITNTNLLPSDTTLISTVTCDSSSAGVFTQTLTNQAGCDSLIITTVSYDPSLIDITFDTGFTCDPTQTGTFQTTLSGSDGCDSIVVLNVLLNPSDTLSITSFTCDPAQAGTFVQVFQNQFGCDSVLIAEVIFDAGPCGPAVSVSGVNPICGADSTGSFTIQILNGQPPLQYDWANNLGNTGTGQITDLSSPTLVQNLPAGVYSITITDLSNQATSTATVTLTAPPALTLAANPVLVFNGFAVRCSDSADGAITSNVNGGTPPIQYAWSTGAITPNLDSLSAGNYSLTLTDANGCTAQTTASLSAPAPLNFSLALDVVDCGDSLVDASITAAGGLAPYVITLDGNILSGTMPSISAGQHLVVLSDDNGCTADSTVTVNLPPTPVIFLPADTTVLLGNTLQITATTNLNSWASLSWQPLPDSSCANCLVQNWTPAGFEQVTVTIVDSFGCTAQATIRVSVDKEIKLYVPNVFSPNEDGFNDTWTVNAGPSVAEIREVQVFDRWGDLQYLWDNPIDPNAWPGWDGTTRGKKAQPGVYVYYLKIKLVDGSEEVVKGDVTILGK